MLISKNKAMFKSVGVCLAVLTILSPAQASDMTSETTILPETQYEVSLLKESSLYPSVNLRKEVRLGCYCSGAYFSLNGGYAWADAGQLTKGNPVVAATDVSAASQSVITNSGLFNEYIAQIPNSSGQQIIGAAVTGYKFDNLRVEVSGEYRQHNILTGATTLGSASVNYSAQSQQYGALISAFYDVDIPDIPVQPYIGLGAGLLLSNTQYSVDYTAGGTTTSASVNFSNGMSFAGAVMAGVAINIADNFTLDLGYRFTNILGGRATYEGQTNGAAINAASGVNLVNISGMETATRNSVDYQETLDYADIIAHEVRAGIRYRF
ncbi:MAG: hypothetical protein COB24_07295 [Hyphomicrobiales bacterium]|nr:MAG: hypothetical protein COB24_07295 [Hyphomicrobiales bacterium]